MCAMTAGMTDRTAAGPGSAARGCALLLALALAPLAVADDLIDAEDLQRAELLRQRALAGSGAYAIVESLVTEVGHRMAGSENDAKGVAWAQAKFKELGFDKVYTQAVTFPVWDRGFENAAILGAQPQTLTITALGGSIGTPAGGISGEVVAFADAQALAQAEAGSLTGKIAYIGNRMQRSRDGSSYGAAVPARVQGAVFAARAGAIAVLIRSVGTSSDANTPHTGTMRYDSMLTRIPAASLGQIDADELESRLAAGEPVEVKLELGSRARSGEYTSANVIGEILGSEAPDEVVLIGGHLDSWDLGQGALDNGAGVAITMAAGALIASLPERPRRSIRVVAFANEEQGIYGGREYARLNSEQVAQHILGAESDFGSGRIWRLASRVQEPALPYIDALHQLLAPMGIERGNNLASGGADLSAMRDMGMPILGLTQDGERYFDYHHTAADTIDKIDPTDLDFNVAVYATLAYLAAQIGPVFGPVETPKP